MNWRPTNEARAKSLSLVAIVWLTCLGCGEAPAPEAGPSTPPKTSTSERDTPEAPPPAASPAAPFVESGACAGCHAEQHAAWLGSHHDLAIQEATPETVLGSFDGAVFEQFGVTTRFRREGPRFVVETQGADGESGVFDVAYAFGVEPLQQYLIDTGGGKLQSLTIAWDTEREAWFSLYPDEPIPPEDPLHWTGRLQRWNTMCAECHSTALQRGYSLARDTYEPTWAELSVGCQACHGPSAAHVAWAQQPDRDGDPRLAVGLAASAEPTASRVDAAAEIEVCAPCHSRRVIASGEAVIGEPFLDHYIPALLRPPLYHADGQVRGEVYVYGSFAQSLMHERGVRCSDCHDPHSLELRAEGDAVCLQCHSEQANARFPTLTPRAYDTPEHHFHPADSEGARCVSCHMPATTFMGVDDRRDHSLRVPRPDLSSRLGTPNPCTTCHADREDAWAAAEIATRSRSRAADRPHHGEVLAAGWNGAPDAAPRLEELAADRGAPAIVRATAIELLSTLGAGAPSVARVLVDATRDREPLVRLAAVRALERQPSPDALGAVLALLEDERRAVRIEAARVLGAVPEERLTPRQRAALSRAISEFRAAQLAVADTPGAHLNLAVMHERRGHAELAEDSYRQALRLAPEFVPARMNLANLYNSLERNEEAERELRAALETVERWPPADGSTAQRGEVHYSLGLLLAEGGRLPEAEMQLGYAVADLPGRSRVAYNHALALQQLGRVEEAERAFLAAAARAPDDADLQNALAILYVQAGRPEQALPYAVRAHELTGSPRAQQLVDVIRGELAPAAD